MEIPITTVAQTINTIHLQRTATPKLWRRAAFYFVISSICLIPCLWQSRIQSGDLASHIYNAWLVQLIRQGRIQGLVIAHQTTNVAFDLLLSELFHVAGSRLSQRSPWVRAF